MGRCRVKRQASARCLRCELCHRQSCSRPVQLLMNFFGKQLSGAHRGTCRHSPSEGLQRFIPRRSAGVRSSQRRQRAVVTFRARADLEARLHVHGYEPKETNVHKPSPRIPKRFPGCRLHSARDGWHALRQRNHDCRTFGDDSRSLCEENSEHHFDPVGLSFLTTVNSFSSEQNRFSK